MRRTFVCFVIVLMSWAPKVWAQQDIGESTYGKLVQSVNTSVTNDSGQPAWRFLCNGAIQDSCAELFTRNPSFPCNLHAGLVLLGAGSDTGQGGHLAWKKPCSGVNGEGVTVIGAMNRNDHLGIRDDGLVGIGSRLMESGTWRPRARLHVRAFDDGLPVITAEDAQVETNPAIAIINPYRTLYIQNTYARTSAEFWDATPSVGGRLLFGVNFETRVVTLPGHAAPAGQTCDLKVNDQGELFKANCS